MIKLEVLELILSCERLPKSCFNLNKRIIDKVLGQNYVIQQYLLDYNNANGNRVLKQHYKLNIIDLYVYDGVIENIVIKLDKGWSNVIGELEIVDYHRCCKFTMNKFISFLEKNQIKYEVQDIFSTNGLISVVVFTKFSRIRFEFNLLRNKWWLCYVDIPTL